MVRVSGKHLEDMSFRVLTSRRPGSALFLLTGKPAFFKAASHFGLGIEQTTVGRIPYPARA